MASHHRIDPPSPGEGSATAATWSPRSRLFFLVGATVTAWGIVALLIGAWI